jgi:hypothetical protein
MNETLRDRMRGRAWTVTFDEGGLRCVAKDRAAYVPYDAIVDATIANTFFGRTVLVLDGSGEGDETRIELANGNPFDVLAAVLAAVTRPHASSRLPALGRNDDSLDAWLSRVRSLAAGEGSAGYRDGSVTIEPSALVTTLGDAAASTEERAACAHALLELGTDDALAAVARILVSRAVPPLVLVATHLARAGTVLVGDDLFSDVRGWLDPRDAAEASSLAKRSDDAQAQRLASVLGEAQREAAAALDNAAAATRGRKLHSLPAGGGGLDTSKWIGRSWGL